MTQLWNTDLQMHIWHHTECVSKCLTEGNPAIDDDIFAYDGDPHRVNYPYSTVISCLS